MLCDTWAVPATSQGRALKMHVLSKYRRCNSSQSAVEIPSSSRTVRMSFTLLLYPLLVTFWCQSSAAWEIQAMNQTWFTQDEKIPFEITNHKSGEQYACLLSGLHTNTHPYTCPLYFIREVNDTTTTCLTTTMHAEMFSILLHFLKVFHGRMIRKNNVWAQEGFTGCSQWPKAKIKREVVFVWRSLIPSWPETCFRLCSNNTWNDPSWM